MYFGISKAQCSEGVIRPRGEETGIYISWEVSTGVYIRGYISQRSRTCLAGVGILCLSFSLYRSYDLVFFSSTSRYMVRLGSGF
jgi:hypothetical protein